MSHARRFGAKVSGNKLKFNVPVSTVNEAINRTLNEEIPEDEATPIPEIDDPIGERGDVSFLYEYLPIRLVADELQKRQSYPAAFAKFKQAALVIVGPSFEIPLYSAEGGGFRSEKYVKMKMAQRIALMYCCNRAAECLINIGKDSEALDWLDEVTILFHNMVFCNHKAMFDWIDVNMNSTEFYYERMKALSLSSKIFVRLGNTAAGVQRRWTAHTNCANLPPDVDQDRMDRLLPNEEMTDLIQFSHPDPKHNQKVSLTQNNLQVTGSWCKLDIPKDKSIRPRLGFGSFIWKSRLYVVAGEKAHLGPWYNDFHYLDLNSLNAGWHELPSYPNPQGMLRMTGWKMCVHDNKAYFFNSRPVLDYFDLVKAKWCQAKTRMADGHVWPFLAFDLMDYSACVAKGKMYVFGGTHGYCHLGTNLLLELDLKTYVWSPLSGYGSQQTLKPDWKIPGPRRHGVIWSDTQVEGSERIYLLFGEADRQGAKMHHEPHASSESFGYGDFWSWDINGRSWRRERLIGNPPSARSEMAYTFNEKLGMAVVFGGYSPSISTLHVEQNKHFSFTYYADTFVYYSPTSPSSTESRPRWKYVLSRGFPTYRAQAQLITDQDTGKTYLFGGYTNAQFVPDSRHEISRSFNDLWQLKLDVPGGDFEDVDLEEERRTAKAGPWQRCFNCGSAGPWKKCGGSCGGRAFFCEPQCLKEGWKEHKTMHRCTNTKK